MWDRTLEILKALTEPPYKVLVLTGHNIGKSHLAACVINWWYDSFRPGVVISTAPSERDVKTIIWKEVRMQRIRAGLAQDFIGPSAPEMRDAPDHYAMGFTAKKGESFVGRHDARMLFVFDEAVGVPGVYWETVSTMFKSEAGHAWLAIGNPTDISSEAYAASKSDNWRVFHLSSLDHPNIAAELAGEPVPVPPAVSVSVMNQWIDDWCDEIDPADRQATDIEWCPGSNRWYRPGPIFQSRVLGQWPDQGTYGVWSHALWQAAEYLVLDFPANELPEIGCDVALFGDDMTAIHARWGDTSVHHEEYNSQNEEYTAKKLILLAKQLCARCNEKRPKQAQQFRAEDIPIKLDAEAFGSGVVPLVRAQGYNVVPIRSGGRANCPSDFPNRRSELWFATAQRARERRLALGLLTKETLKNLEGQALMPTWRLTAGGAQMVEPKEQTKQKLKRSPDGMDALNLAYYRIPEFGAIGVEPEEDIPVKDQEDTEQIIVDDGEPDWRSENSPWRATRPDWFGGSRGRPEGM